MDQTAELPSCRCAQCWGLQEYGLAHGRDYGLPRSPGCGHNQPVKLSVLTFGETPENVVKLPTVVRCDGSMTCPCDSCADERAARARVGQRDTEQPWVPKPPRALRGAA